MSRPRHLPCRILPAILSALTLAALCMAQTTTAPQACDCKDLERIAEEKQAAADEAQRALANAESDLNQADRLDHQADLEQAHGDKLLQDARDYDKRAADAFDKAATATTPDSKAAWTKIANDDVTQRNSLEQAKQQAWNKAAQLRAEAKALRDNVAALKKDAEEKAVAAAAAWAAYRACRDQQCSENRAAPNGGTLTGVSGKPPGNLAGVALIFVGPSGKVYQIAPTATQPVRPLPLNQPPYSQSNDDLTQCPECKGRFAALLQAEQEYQTALAGPSTESAAQAGRNFINAYNAYVDCVTACKWRQTHPISNPIPPAAPTDKPAPPPASGTISGSVTDQRGMVISNATIRATNVQTGLVFSTSSDGSGTYSFGPLAPGTYQIQVTAQGFQSAAAGNIVVIGNSVSDMGSVKLYIAGDTGAVEGPSEAPSAGPTQGAAAPSTSPGQTLGTLPGTGIGGSLGNMALFVPGAASTGGINLSNISGASSSGSSGMDQGGQGQNNTDNSAGGTGIFVTDPEFVQQYVLVTNNFGPEYGRNAGSAVNIITKSGTNTWHGTLFGSAEQSFLGSLNNSPAAPVLVTPNGIVPAYSFPTLGGRLYLNPLKFSEFTVRSGRRPGHEFLGHYSFSRATFESFPGVAEPNPENPAAQPAPAALPGPPDSASSPQVKITITPQPGGPDTSRLLTPSGFNKPLFANPFLCAPPISEPSQNLPFQLDCTNLFSPSPGKLSFSIGPSPSPSVNLFQDYGFTCPLEGSATTGNTPFTIKCTWEIGSERRFTAGEYLRMHLLETGAPGTNPQVTTEKPPQETSAAAPTSTSARSGGTPGGLTCTATSMGTPVVRTEGETEPGADIILTCTPSNQPPVLGREGASSQQGFITAIFDHPVESPDAYLLIDEPETSPGQTNPPPVIHGQSGTVGNPGQSNAVTFTGVRVIRSDKPSRTLRFTFDRRGESRFLPPVRSVTFQTSPNIVITPNPLILPFSQTQLTAGSKPAGSTAGATGPVSASPPSPNHPLFWGQVEAGLGVGAGNSLNDCEPFLQVFPGSPCTRSSHSLAFDAGGQLGITPYFALGALYNHLGSVDRKASAPTFLEQSSGGTQFGSFMARGIIPVGPVSLFGEGGIAVWQTKLKEHQTVGSSTTPITTKSSVNGVSPAAGVGADFMLSKRFGVGLHYQYFEQQKVVDTHYHVGLVEFHCRF